MKIHETLSDALGIEHEVLPAVVVQQVQEVIVPTEGQIDQEEDYRLARKTFRQLINKGNDAIEGISDLAKESESPRAYEVMATLMKTVADTTKDLFELQKKNKDLPPVAYEPGPPEWQAETITITPCHSLCLIFLTFSQIC